MESAANWPCENLSPPDETARDSSRRPRATNATPPRTAPSRAGRRGRNDARLRRCPPPRRDEIRSSSFSASRHTPPQLRFVDRLRQAGFQLSFPLLRHLHLRHFTKIFGRRRQRIEERLRERYSLANRQVQRGLFNFRYFGHVFSLQRCQKQFNPDGFSAAVPNRRLVRGWVSESSSSDGGNRIAGASNDIAVGGRPDHRLPVSGSPGAYALRIYRLGQLL